MLVEVTPENKDNFLNLAPKRELMAIGKDVNTFGIGYAEDKNSLPEGVLLFGLDAELGEDEKVHPVAVLKYINIADDSRDMYMGTYLFSEFLDAVKESGAEAVRTDIPVGPDYDPLYNVLTDFGFHFEMSEVYSIERPVSALKDSDFFKQVKKGKALPLREVPQKTINLLLKKLSDDTAYFDYDIIDDYNAYDPDVSRVVFHDDTINGLFLIREDVDGALLPVLLKTEASLGAKAKIDLVAEASRAAIEKYPENKTIRMTAHSQMDCDLINMIFPDAEPYLNYRGYFYL